MSFDLTGKVAIVTGSTKGIGRAAAQGLAEAGAAVVVSSRKQDLCDDVAAQIAADTKADTLGLACHVGDWDAVPGFVDAVVERFGRIDVLVNNAGGWPPKPALRTSEKEFEAAFRFNVTTAFVLTRLVVPRVVETAGGGAVVNISSVAGRHHAPGFAAYGTAKAALSFLTQNLAQEFAPKVRVNAIAVGSIQTEALAGVLTPEIERQMVELTPLGRLGRVEDIAACALYLASPAASYVTGAAFVADGGLTASNGQPNIPAIFAAL